MRAFRLLGSWEVWLRGYQLATNSVSGARRREERALGSEVSATWRGGPATRWGQRRPVPGSCFHGPFEKEEPAGTSSPALLLRPMHEVKCRRTHGWLAGRNQLSGALRAGGGQWTQRQGAVNVIFGEATGTLAYDGSGPASARCSSMCASTASRSAAASCRRTRSRRRRSFSRSAPRRELVRRARPSGRRRCRLSSNGACEAGSTVDSTRFQVLNFG